jgi:hypothetical protein
VEPRNTTGKVPKAHVWLGFKNGLRFADCG